jgi:predicted ATPase
MSSPPPHSTPVAPTKPAAAATGAEAHVLAAAQAAWQVRLLGRFSLDDGRQRLTRLRSRAAMALLARLALAPTRDHSREELATLLWPDADGDAGRNRLRQTLSVLRAVLEPPGAGPVLQADRRVLRVVPGALWCDAVAFEQAQRAGQAELALSLYGGELLPGFYDEWVLDERQRLQALAERLGDGQAPPGAASGGATAAARSSAGVAPTPAGQAHPATARVLAPHAQTAAAPTAVPAPAAAARLPQYLTRLIGADVQGARLLALVHEHRLVTVLGPGGAGKTRLAVEVARAAGQAAHGGGGAAAAARFDAAIFVSLVGAATRDDVFDRLKLALRVDGGGDAVELILATLQARALLVLLDNAEQLDTDAAAAIALLAERAPQVHWLVTSRRPLALDGERHFVIEALELPAPDAPLDEAAMNPAVALFVDRAQAHRADFHLRANNRDALIALVRWLDGLPLAIELAASHARTLGPAELLALLREAREHPAPDGGSLAFLARRGARTGSDPRHASMLATIAWGWALLDGPQRTLLAALAPLPAGARTPLAAALAGCSTAQVQARLDELVTMSVLRAQPGSDGAVRYTPYEPVREFVLGQLGREALRAQRRRALDAWLAWAEAMPPTPPLPEVRDELPNLTPALAAARDDGPEVANTALRLVLTMQTSWGEIAVPAGALEALSRLLDAPGLDDSLAAAAHALAASCCQEAGRPDDAMRHADAAVARPCPDGAMRATVCARTARVRWRVARDHAAARALIDEGLPLARALGRRNTEASLISLQAHLATVVDRDPVRGAELSAQSLALWRQSGNRHLVNAGRYNVAVNRLKAGHAAEVIDEFVALADEGLALQDWDLASGAHEARGNALLKLRRWPEALAAMQASVQVAWDGLEMLALVYALWNAAPALARCGHGETAAQTMGAAEALWRARFGAFDGDDARDLRRTRRWTRLLCGADAARSAWARGATLPLAEVVRGVLAAA